MKQEEKTRKTKERIIKAAMKEFGEKGYAGATMNSICRAGIPKGLIYYNFANKDTIYLECARRCMKELMDYLEQQGVRNDPWKYLEARAHFFQENRNETGMFFEVLLQPPLKLRKEMEEIRKEFNELNEKLYLQILSEVRMRPGVSKEDALQYFSLMQNMFNGYFNSPAYMEVECETRLLMHENNLSKLLDFIIYGIAEGGNK